MVFVFCMLHLLALIDFFLSPSNQAVKSGGRGAGEN